VTVGIALAGVHHHLSTTRDELANIQAQDRKLQYIEGTERALCLVNTTSEFHDNQREGQEDCERTLALYGVLDRDDWQDNPDWQRLAEPDRRRLLEDTRELLLMLAWTRARSGSDPAEAAREALSLLSRAESIPELPPSSAIWLVRASYLEQLGDW